MVCSLQQEISTELSDLSLTIAEDGLLPATAEYIARPQASDTDTQSSGHINIGPISLQGQMVEVTLTQCESNDMCL